MADGAKEFDAQSKRDVLTTPCHVQRAGLDRASHVLTLQRESTRTECAPRQYNPFERGSTRAVEGELVIARRRACCPRELPRP